MTVVTSLVPEQEMGPLVETAAVLMPILQRSTRAHQAGLSRRSLAGAELSESVRCHRPGLELLTNGSVQQQQQQRIRRMGPNEIAVVPDFHKQILFSDEAHFWLNGYVSKQNCRIWSETNPQVYVETPLHPEKLTVWCALWAGGILLQKR
ncbi:putative transposable element [Trichonephila clavipes]|nr:putative transposable element [Trichonephila clavipes]